METQKIYEKAQKVLGKKHKENVDALISEYSTTEKKTRTKGENKGTTYFKPKYSNEALNALKSSSYTPEFVKDIVQGILDDRGAQDGPNGSIFTAVKEKYGVDAHAILNCVMASVALEDALIVAAKNWRAKKNAGEIEAPAEAEAEAPAE